MCLLHVIKKLKADRILGSFNTEGTLPTVDQIKQDYSDLHCRLHNEIAKIAFVHVDSDDLSTVGDQAQV